MRVTRLRSWWPESTNLPSGIRGVVQTISMNRPCNVMLLAFLVCGGIFAPQAADQVIGVPKDWQLNPTQSAVATSPNGVAVAAYKYNSSVPPIVTASNVIQVSNGATVSEYQTAGRVVGLRYSPNGQTLLVHSIDPALSGDQTRTALIDLAGNLIWLKETTGYFRFSNDGQALYAMSGNDLAKSRHVEIFDVTGNPTRNFDAGGSLNDAIVFGDGDTIVVSDRYSILAFDLSQGAPVKLWQTDLEEYDPRVIRLRHFSGNRILAEQHFGRFLVMSPVGAIEYRYNPEYLGKNDPNATVASYANLRPFESGIANKITLFGKKNAGLQLDLGSQTLTSKTFAAFTPLGSVLRSTAECQKLVILSSTQIRLRPI